jgi:NCS1 family nucleobase:cation symporter-1
MSEANLVEADTGSALQVEHHGYDYIGEEGRYLRPRTLFPFWWGSSIGANGIIVGAGVVALGLSLWMALIVVVVGTSAFALIAYVQAAGPRSGMPTMTYTRSAFGVKGNRINGVFSWFVLVGSEVLNELFIVLAIKALVIQFGWHNPGRGGLLLFIAIGICVPAVIAIYGHRMMFLAQKVGAVSMTVVIVLVAIWIIPHVNWNFHETVHGHVLFGAVLTGLAVVIGVPLSYACVAGDYARYLPSNTRMGQIVSWTFSGVGLVTLLCSGLGVLIYTVAPTVTSDPAGALKPLIPVWLYVLFMLVVALGSIANQIITFYSSGLTMQAMGVPLARWRATIVDCVVSAAIIIYIEFYNQSLSTVVGDYLSFVNVWAGPFLAIMLVDAIRRRWSYDPVGMHTLTPVSPYWGKGGWNVAGITAQVIGMIVGLLTINNALFESPFAHLAWNADFSWLFPFLVGGAVYWAMTAKRGVLGAGAPALLGTAGPVAAEVPEPDRPAS